MTAPLIAPAQASVRTSMDTSTLPPGPQDAAADRHAAALASHERLRRPGESGLMRALAVAWASQRNTERNK